MVGAAIALRIFAQQLLYVFSVLTHMVFIAVVAIDEHCEAGGVQSNLGAFVVRGGCSHTALGIAVDGQAGNVDHAPSDAFVRLAFLSDAERQRAALELVGIKAADAVAIGNTAQIDEVYERVDLVEGFALQLAADKRFGGRTIA